MISDSRHKNTLASDNAGSPFLTDQGYDAFLTLPESDYPELPDLGFQEPDPQWDDPVTFDADFDAFRECGLSDSLEDIFGQPIVENHAQEVTSEAIRRDRSHGDYPDFSPLGLDMLQYLEQSETPYKEQETASPTHATVIALPTLDRKVLLINGAANFAQQSALIHDILASHAMTRFTQSVHTYTQLVKTLNFPEYETQDLISRQANARVETLQKMWIEPRVGEFSNSDQDNIDKFPRLEERLLAVMHIGLIKQQSLELNLLDGNADTNVMQDIHGSCLLEARNWQLELLRAWVMELDSIITRVSGIISEALLTAGGKG